MAIPKAGKTYSHECRRSTSLASQSWGCSTHLGTLPPLTKVAELLVGNCHSEILEERSFSPFPKKLGVGRLLPDAAFTLGRIPNSQVSELSLRECKQALKQSLQIV